MLNPLLIACHNDAADPSNGMRLAWIKRRKAYKSMGKRGNRRQKAKEIQLIQTHDIEGKQKAVCSRQEAGGSRRIKQGA